MLAYHTDSWHYRLVLFVLGKNFFMENVDIDLDESIKQNKIAWVKKPRVVNFCPYCRAVLYSMLAAGPVIVSRKIKSYFPQEPKKPLTCEELLKKLERHSFWTRVWGGGVVIALGVGLSILNWVRDGELEIYYFTIGIGIFILFGAKTFPLIEKLIALICKFLIKHWPSWLRRKPKQQKGGGEEKYAVKKSPNFILEFFTNNHDKICPPVVFLPKNNPENLK